MSQDHSLAIGDRVCHHKLGDGSVTGFGGSKGTVTVKFDRSGEKRIVSSFLTLSEPSKVETPQADTEPPRASAVVIPFPISRTQSWRNIQEIFAGRPWNGRYSKANYAEGVIKANIERLQRLGVSPERIDAEIASLQALFYADDNEKRRA